MSMAQSPTISIPKKKTDDVDWTGPIRQVISHSYGESPDTYSSECAALQRCRQDAVKGAGSDITARDLLYKYFGQLELLELRFTDIRVVFPWHDAFTGKLTTQTSIAFEKASIIFQIAATHSAIAISQNRSDPEGLKRSFHYFKTAAGMLTYINDNFLHAPSTDLSKEVIKFLTGIMLAQATEVFYEKLVDEKKSATLISKVASQAAYLYTSLTEEVKEFMGRGIFDRNWVTLLQIKAKYFTALSQYQRSLADSAASLHGEALTRLTVAETQAKEAARLARNFNSDFLSTLSPTLPPDAGSSIVDLTKNLQTLLTEKKAEAQRDNDLIYNAICPPEATLSAIDKLSVATPIPIQEVYGTPEIQKIIGPDMFAKLIPLSVHEGASVYSEEKAKLVRAEAEKAEIADSDARAALDSMGLPAGLRKWRELVAGHDDEDALPKEVEAWAEEVARGDGIHGIDRQFEQLDGLKRKVDQELGIIAQELESESRECETMRVKYDLLWEQEPSAAFTRSMRQDMKAHQDAFSAASASDARVVELWNSVHPDLILLLAGNDAISGFLTAAENANTSAAGPSLLDLADDVRSNDTVDVADIKRKVNDIEERIGRINKIKRERSEVLKDLKEKIQTDDVSQLLLLNRRSPNVEPGLFATELEKFRPYQSRLASTVQVQQSVIDEISSLFKLLTSNPRSKEWMKKADLREKRRGDAIARLSRAREGWSETSDTLRKGLQFYQDLYGLVSQLKRSVSSYVATRADERRKLVAKAEAASVGKAKAASSTGPPPPPPPKSPITGLEGQFALMGFGQPQLPPPPPQIPGSWGATSPPPPAQYPPPPTQSPASVSSPYSAFPPPPSRVGSLPPPPPPPSIPSQPPQGDPYARLFDAPGLSSQFAFGQSPAPPPPPPSSYPPPSMQTAPPPPPQSSQQYYGYAPQQPSSPYSYSAPGYPSQQPAPPPPPPQQPGHYWQPPPGQQPYPPPPNAGQQYGGYSR